MHYRALPQTYARRNARPNAPSNSQFDDGSKKTIFEFYPDELSFIEDEFIGLTEEQARKLKVEKDIKYLQS